MTETPQLSGKDLARQALAAYKTSTRNTPTTPAKPRRKRVTRRGDGRDPISFAAAIEGLGADLPLEAGVAGGSLLDRWAELCPQYAGYIEPAGYDEQTGRLDLRPGSHAYATQLRMLGGQLARQINDKMGRQVVRTIRVLPVGTLTTAAAPPAAEQTGPQGPAKTREMACAGYRQTRALVLENKLELPPANTYEEEAARRQIAALRANRQPVAEDREAMWAQADAEAAAGPKPGSMEASERAALAFKRREQAGLTQPCRAFDVA